MDYVLIVGLAAGLLTTFSTLPEIVKTARMKETRDLSHLWMGMMSVGCFLWLLYGFWISSLPLMIANFISLVLFCILVLLKLRYR